MNCFKCIHDEKREIVKDADENQYYVCSEGDGKQVDCMVKSIMCEYFTAKNKKEYPTMLVSQELFDDLHTSKALRIEGDKLLCVIVGFGAVQVQINRHKGVKNNETS